MGVFKRAVCAAALIFIIDGAAFSAIPADAQWYISNGAGMLIEKTYKTRALRSKYAISLQNIKPEDTPAELRKYYTPPWRVECRVLYEDGLRLRTQWVFKDAANTSYLIAAISNDGSGFIEWYDDQGYVVEEQRLLVDGSGYFVAYTYKDGFLLRAVAHAVESKLPKDEKKPPKLGETPPEPSVAVPGTGAPPAGQAAQPPLPAPAPPPAETKPEPKPEKKPEKPPEIKVEEPKSGGDEKRPPGGMENFEMPQIPPEMQAEFDYLMSLPEEERLKELRRRLEEEMKKLNEQQTEGAEMDTKELEDLRLLNDAIGSASDAADEAALAVESGVEDTIAEEAAGEEKTEAEAEAEAKSAPPEEKVEPASAKVRNPEGPMDFPPFFVAASGKEGAPLWTDNYRYTRNRTLRAIERLNHNEAAVSDIMRVSFEKFVKDSPADKNFVSPGTSVSSAFLEDVAIKSAPKVTYTTDARRRILNEVRLNDEGAVVGEITNEWKGDKISKIIWKSPGDERTIEFLYSNSGDRISERDYRNGVLERTVTIDKEQEIEELYLDGKVALKAIWQNGKKISEERFLNRRLR
jgi:hypothetical protein